MHGSPRNTRPPASGWISRGLPVSSMDSDHVIVCASFCLCLRSGRTNTKTTCSVQVILDDRRLQCNCHLNKMSWIQANGMETGSSISLGTRTSDELSPRIQKATLGFINLRGVGFTSGYRSKVENAQYQWGRYSYAAPKNDRWDRKIFEGFSCLNTAVFEVLVENSGVILWVTQRLGARYWVPVFSQS